MQSQTNIVQHVIAQSLATNTSVVNDNLKEEQNPSKYGY